MKDYIVLNASEYVEEFEDQLHDDVMCSLNDSIYELFEDIYIPDVLKKFEPNRYQRLFEEFLHHKKLDLMEENERLNIVDIDWSM